MKSSHRMAAVETGSEEVFRVVVRQYANLVYSVARRRLGNCSLAEDATQIVFVRLAAGPKLENIACLGSWLHREALRVSIDLWRSESRRRIREEKSIEPQVSEEKSAWEEVAPHLDEALDQLSDDERKILLLRFFEHKRFAEVGIAFGISENAAKMRVSRALGKLHALLLPYRLACSVLALGVLMLARATEDAPAAFLEKLGLIEVSASWRIPQDGFSNWKRKLSYGMVTLVIGTLLFGYFVFASIGRMALPAFAAHERESVAAKLERTPTYELSRNRENRLRIDPVRTRTRLVVIDPTGSPISNARVHIAYRYKGGEYEIHKALSNTGGVASIPYPNNEGEPMAIIFVTVENFVPTLINWEPEGFPNEYTMEMDPATIISGHVVDEEGIPVEDVEVTIQIPGTAKGEHVTSFNSPDVARLTDAAGSFRLPFIPKSWPSLLLTLRANNYAITYTNLSFTTFAPDDLRLVIQRGSVISGHVYGPDGRPVPNARFKELHNFRWRPLSPVSADDGSFTLTGLSDPAGPEVTIGVQADLFAPQIKVIRPSERTNSLDLTLGKAAIFRGRIINEGGMPLEDASIGTDAEVGTSPKYEWFTRSGSDGRFEWNAAPQEKILYFVEKEGYLSRRKLPLTPDSAEREITLQSVENSAK